MNINNYSDRAGVGRTGTFIAIDRLLQELHSGAPSISVFNTVLELRKHRPLMVQTEEQYIYIHLCLADAIRELFPALPGIIHKLSFSFARLFFNLANVPKACSSSPESN